MKAPNWKGRAASQRALVLERLRQAGPVGVLAKELYDDPQCRYGRSPRNRISELKQMGFKIEKQWEGRNYRYTLVEETQAPKALPDYNAQKKLDWYVKQTGKPRPSQHPWKTAFSPNRLAQDDCFVLTPPAEPRQ
jgi:hypothetical protein